MIKIISTHLSDSRFVYFQKKLLDKFMIEDFEFIVFDDSQNEMNRLNRKSDTFESQDKESIKKVCSDLSVRRVEIPNSIHTNPSLVHKNPSFVPNDPCGWCANAVQFSVNWCFDNLDPDDIVLNIDGDMFPICSFSVSEFMDGYNLAGVPQHREDIEYVWNGIFGFRVGGVDRDLFQWSPIPKCDVGGMMKYYLEKNPNYKKIFHLWSCTWNMDSLDTKNGIPAPHIVNFLDSLNYKIPDSIKIFIENDPRNVRSNNEILYFSEIYHPGLIHYRAGGNWDGFNRHEDRKKHFFNFFSHLINE
jgi:hypothetical protein